AVLGGGEKDGRAGGSSGRASRPAEGKTQEVSATVGTEAGPVVEVEGSAKRQEIVPGGAGTE
ncbi:MAG: hypothetical protein O7A63_06020, partial [Acidobacteria bacterium]|nr:hypothetical protein [Acidobacteriota bacterium]